MAITKKKENTEEMTYTVKVLRVKEFKSGDIGCDLEVNGVKINSCTYKSGTSAKNGKEYAFISFPSRKGSDDKYYNQAYFHISDELLSDIEKQIEGLL